MTGGKGHLGGGGNEVQSESSPLKILSLKCLVTLSAQPRNKYETHKKGKTWRERFGETSTYRH